MKLRNIDFGKMLLADQFAILYSPGRFYVAVISKMILADIITHFDFKLEKPDITPAFSFGKARTPNPFMNVLVRRRGTS